MSITRSQSTRQNPQKSRSFLRGLMLGWLTLLVYVAWLLHNIIVRFSAAHTLAIGSIPVQILALPGTPEPSAPPPAPLTSEVMVILSWLVASWALFLLIVLLSLTLVPLPETNAPPASRSPVPLSRPRRTSRALSSPLAPSKPAVFISHASGDNAFGNALADRLREQGFDVWYDSHGGRDVEHGTWSGGIPPATYWQDEIVRALSASTIFVLILTERAIASKWVQDEIRLAWSQKNSADTTNGMTIVPVLRETCAVPPLVAQVQFVDYRHEVNQDQAWRDLLFAVRHGQTIPAKNILEGPPFDLGLLPPLGHFVGREETVEHIINLLTKPGDPAAAAAPLSAINGLAGIGKTALATEVVRRLMLRNAFPHGIAVVDCRGQSDPTILIRRALSRFLPDRKDPEETDIGVLESLAAQLFAGKQPLIVFDNLQSGVPFGQALSLLQAAGAAVLVTSREPLPSAPIATSVRLDLLSDDEAIALFEQYLGGELELDEVGAARAVVAALGRHTLAIKLAAANAGALGRSLVAMAHELETYPEKALLLANSEEAVLYVLSSSIAALASEALALFVALGGFGSNNIGRQAALAIAQSLGDPNPDASLQSILLLRLVDLGYLEFLVGGDDVDRERLRVHPLVQLYTHDLFTGKRAPNSHLVWTAAQQGRVIGAIAEWYTAYTDSVVTASLQGYLALMPDESNIAAALNTALASNDDATVAHLCVSMGPFWRDTGRLAAGLHYLPLGIAAADRVAAPTNAQEDRLRQAEITTTYGSILLMVGRIDEAETTLLENLRIRQTASDRKGEGRDLSALGTLALRSGHYEEARRRFHESMSIFRDLGDRDGEGEAEGGVGVATLQMGQVTEAETHLVHSLSILRELNDRKNEAEVLGTLGQLELARGRLDEATTYFQEALQVIREISNRFSEGTVLGYLGIVLSRQGRLSDAEVYIHEALTIFRELGDIADEGAMLHQIGTLALQRGRLDEAKNYYQQSLEMSRKTHDRRLEGSSYADLGVVAVRAGQFEEAAAYLLHGLEIDREMSYSNGEAIQLSNLGVASLRRGRLTEAEAYLREGLPIFQQVEDLEGEGVTLSRLAEVKIAQGQLEEGETLLRQSLEIRRRVQDRRGEGTDLSNLGVIAFLRDNLQQAQDYFDQSLALRRAVQDRQGEGVDILWLALIREKHHDTDQAEALYRQSLALAHEAQNGPDIANAMRELGRFLITSRHAHEDGGQLLQEAIGRYTSMGMTSAAGETARLAESLNIT